jgi:hypothetical protein
MAAMERFPIHDQVDERVQGVVQLDSGLPLFRLGSEFEDRPNAGAGANGSFVIMQVYQRGAQGPKLLGASHDERNGVGSHIQIVL